MVIVTKITIYFIVFILIGYSLLRFYHLWNRRGLPDWLYWMFQAVMPVSYTHLTLPTNCTV